MTSKRQPYRWIQLSIRLALIAMIVFAIGSFFLQHWFRSNPHLIVKLDPQGGVTVAGRPIPPDALLQELRTQWQRRRETNPTPILLLRAHTEASADEVAELLETATKAGWERIEMTFSTD